MPPITEATLAALKNDFLLGADLARLLALNATLEAARVGESGEAYSAAAASSDQRISRALASSEQAARLLRETLGDCMLPMRAP